MSADEHKGHAPTSVAFAVVTVSDTRTEATDTGGAAAKRTLEVAGHRVVARSIVPDEPAAIADALREALGDPAIEAVLLTGGTGVAPRDRTIEAIEPLLERRLEGFGEVFRSLSFAEIGSAAILTRAIAGTARGKPVFAVPGSPKGVELAVTRLVAPEAGHLVAELRRPSHRRHL